VSTWLWFESYGSPWGGVHVLICNTRATHHCGAVANYTAINYMAFIRRICGINIKSMNVFVFPLRSSSSKNILAEGGLRTHLAHVSTSHRRSASRGSPWRPWELPTRPWVLCVYLTTKRGLLTIRHRGIKIVSFYKWTILQDTGAPTAHDKPGSLTCPV